jgi:hypothetical protein
MPRRRHQVCKSLASDGDKKADHRGEHGISRKPLRAGMSGDFRWLAVNTRVHTTTNMRTRGCGCIGRPAFPTPSVFRADVFSKPRAHRAAGMRRCVANPTNCHRPPPGLASGEPDDRLRRAIQYSEKPVIESISRGVLDTPLSRSMTTICDAVRLHALKRAFAHPATLMLVASPGAYRGTTHENVALTLPNPASSISTVSPAVSQIVLTRLPVSTISPARRLLPRAAR